MTRRQFRKQRAADGDVGLDISHRCQCEECRVGREAARQRMIARGQTPMTDAEHAERCRIATLAAKARDMGPTR